MRPFAALLTLSMLVTAGAPLVGRAQQAATQTIAGARFDALAKRALASVSLDGDAKLVEAYPTRDQIVRAGSLSLDVESPLVTPAFVNVPVRIEVGGTFIRTVYVGYRVQQYVRTAVAAHDIIAGTVLQPSDLTIERIASNGRLASGTEALVGRKVYVSLRKGQPVYPEETTINQIVKAGSTVVLIVNDGGVSVVTDGQARSGGGLGEEVSVYNPTTNKMLSGTVVGPDRVELDILGVTH